MQTIFEKFSVIVGFMILCIAINTAAGNDVLNHFLLLVLLSMIVINSDKFVTLLKGEETK